MKEKTLDKDTIVAYHSFVQQRIRSDLNGLGIGHAWLPCRLAILFAILSATSLVTGILVLALRHRHVYLIDWWAQFTGPGFIILFLILAFVATYLLVIAKRRSNLYRRELFFRPIGDFGVAVVHKSNLQFEQEQKPELKSGTTPHRGVMPNSAAYSNSERRHREGHDNRAYREDRDRRRDDRDRRERRPEGERRPRDDRERRPQDDRERRPRDDRERRPRDDRDRRPREDGERRERDPKEEERRRAQRKEREARGEMDPREKEHRERRERERSEGRRPPKPEGPQGQSSPRTEASRQEGRKAGRGAPKLPADASGFVPPDRIVLDADFGQPAGYMETSSRASESDL